MPARESQWQLRTGWRSERAAARQLQITLRIIQPISAWVRERGTLHGFWTSFRERRLCDIRAGKKELIWKLPNNFGGASTGPCISAHARALGATPAAPALTKTTIRAATDLDA
jgi:hypothetical protein